MKRNLTTILTDLCVTRQRNNDALGGGLRFQFKEATPGNPHHRLCCYRLGVEPGTVELGTVRRYLEPLVKRPLHLGALFTYEHSSGEMALCRVFSWHPETAKQAALLDVPEEKKVVYE